MSEHTHGSMNTEVHEKTFDGLIKTMKWVGGACVFVLLFLAVFNT